MTWQKPRCWDVSDTVLARTFKLYMKVISFGSDGSPEGITIKRLPHNLPDGSPEGITSKWLPQLQVQDKWFRYTQTCDVILTEAFRLNIKRSLMVMSKAINGDAKSGAYPLFNVKVVLDDNKVGAPWRKWSRLTTTLPAVCPKPGTTAGLRMRHVFQIKRRADMSLGRLRNDTVSGTRSTPGMSHLVPRIIALWTRYECSRNRTFP